MIPLNLKYFNEANVATPAIPATLPAQADATDGNNSPDATTNAPVNPIDYDSLDYGEMLKNSKSFQSFLDKEKSKDRDTAVKNAVQKEMERIQRINDAKATESEKLKLMDAEQRAAYFEKKYKEAEAQRGRDKEIESLKGQTLIKLSEHGIPDVFMDVFNFDNATAEEIMRRVDMLAEYEYYPKGSVQQKIELEAKTIVDTKLKQTGVETRTVSTQETDPFIQGFNSNKYSKYERK